MNRAYLLEETLSSLVCGSLDDVELVIIDSSEDGQTEAVVRRWTPHFGTVRYRRCPPNGVDRAYSLSVELSTGTYCWLMTDDDVVRPGAIQALREATDLNYALIVVNASVFNTDLSEFLGSSRLAHTQDREYGPDQFESFFRDTAAYLSFIGGVVIRRDVWMGRSKEPYWGTEFVHVGVIFQRTLRDPVLVIAQPYIKIRYGNALWTSRGFSIWMFKWPRLIWSFSHFAEKSKRHVCDPYPYLRINVLVKERAKGCYTKNQYDKSLKPLLQTPMLKISAILIAVFPQRLLNLLCIAYLKKFYPSAKDLLLDFQRSARELRRL